MYPGPNWPEFEPLPAGELSDLLLSHAVHVMPSEREGFGHSINEGRAAGTRVIAAGTEQGDAGFKAVWHVVAKSRRSAKQQGIAQAERTAKQTASPRQRSVSAPGGTLPIT